ncbi:MAG: hypothetical protein JWR38_1935 [Mucilaginibacter sp.]|nr:hypothetical protein [Mucilaginibacter sp.]
MNTLKEKVQTFNQLIINDETVKAMEVFYADEVELQENEATPRAGKEACIVREKAALAKFGLGLEILKQAIDEENQVVFSEYLITITNKATQKVSYRNEISVQQWKNGLVTKEKFYYNETQLL